MMGARIMSIGKRISLVVIASIATVSAWAHGDPVAKRGGTLQQVDDLAFELVVRDKTIDLYVYDGIDDVASDHMSGVLTIIAGGEKKKAELRPAGINRLRAIAVTAVSGDRVVAFVRLADGKSLAVDFEVP
jgi:hypothetical protein